MSIILVVIVLMLLLGVIPGMWGHTANIGYGPSGVIAVVLIVLLILMLLGKI